MKNKVIYFIIFFMVIFFQGTRMINLTTIFKKNWTKLENFIESNPNFFQDNRLKDNEIKRKSYLIITDPVGQITKDGKGLIDNVEDIFKFSKIGYDVKAAEDISGNLSDYKGIILIKSNYSDMERRLFEEVKKYTLNGGVLYFFNGLVINNPFKEFVGIEGNEGMKKGNGIVVKEDFYPGFERDYTQSTYHDADYLDVTLNENALVIAENCEEKPLYWQMNQGEGRIIYANNLLFMDNYMQGFMKQLISYGSDFFISPTLNSKVFHIDDFPLPLPNAISEVIYKNYQVNNQKFIQDIWWTDMRMIAKKNGLIYSTFIIADYEVDSTKEELEGDKKFQLKILSELGREVMQKGWEVGVHGYNHNPLSLADGISYGEYEYYKPWDSVESMKQAQVKLKEVLAKLYGDNFRVYSYVAPSNLMTKEGKQAIVEEFPRVKSFSGVFEKNSGEKGLLEQKIGVDPDFPQVYSLPRFSTGYLERENVLWNMFNGIAAYGYVSHFVHPDDIISDDRHYGVSWEEMKKSFSNIVESINTENPELVSRTQLGLSMEYYKIENIKFNIEEEKDKIKVNTENFNGDFYVEIRIRDKEITNIKGGKYKLKKQYKNNNLYLVKINKPDLEISVK